MAQTWGGTVFGRRQGPRKTSRRRTTGSYGGATAPGGGRQGDARNRGQRGGVQPSRGGGLTPRQRARKRVNKLLEKNKGKGNKGKGGLTRDERAGIFLNTGPSYDPVEIWNKANAKQRARIRRAARRRGLTISGMAGGGPVALRERSPRGLRTDATRTVNQAFRGAYGELTDQERKAKNLAEKRHADNLYYQQWLTTKQAELDASADAAANAAVQAQGAERDAMTDWFTEQKAKNMEAMGNAGGLEGINLEGSTALDNTDEAALAHAVRMAGDSAERGALVSADTLRRGLQSQNLAVGRNRLREIDSDLLSSLADLGIERKKLGLERAGAIAKEIARLGDLEVTKAQSKREFNLAAEKLGVEAADKAADNKRENAKLKLAQKEFRLERRLKRIDIQLEKRDLSRKERETLLKEREIINKELEVGAYAEDDSPSGSGGGQEARNGETRQENRELWNEIYNIYETNGNPTQAWRQNPLLRKAAEQMYKRGGKGIDKALARKIRRQYGIGIKVWTGRSGSHPTAT